LIFVGFDVKNWVLGWKEINNGRSKFKLKFNFWTQSKLAVKLYCKQMNFENNHLSYRIQTINIDYYIKGLTEDKVFN
jgi:hypothetical protein